MTTTTKQLSVNGIDYEF